MSKKNRKTKQAASRRAEERTQRNAQQGGTPQEGMSFSADYRNETAPQHTEVVIKKTPSGATVPVRVEDGQAAQTTSAAQQAHAAEPGEKQKIEEFFDEEKAQAVSNRVKGASYQNYQEEIQEQPPQENEPVAAFQADYRADTQQPVTVQQAKTPESAQENSHAEDDETEIDDFLEEGDSDDRLLTKWHGQPRTSTEQERPKRTAPAGVGRHRYGVFVGTIVLLLALVGVIFVVGSVGKTIYSAVTDDSKLREYDAFLAPIVMQDPVPFEDSTKANEEFVLNASLWKAITANNGSNYTDYDDNGRVLIPLGDVVDACHELFGPDCQLQPKTPEQETFFEYNSEENKFHVSLYSSDSAYTPYTEKAKRRGDTTVLRVGYVSPTDESRNQVSSAVTEPTPVKYMQYVLKTNASTGKYYVYAVKADETATASK